MELSGLTLDLAYFAVWALGDLARFIAGGLIAAAFVDGLITAIQLMHK